LGSFAKETYNFKEPTNRSHPIPHLQGATQMRNIDATFDRYVREIMVFIGKPKGRSRMISNADLMISNVM